MLKERTSQQSELELVSIESLVPRDHLLRKIDRAIDFSFIYEKARPLYCADNDRPPIDPVMLLKWKDVLFLPLNMFQSSFSNGIDVEADIIQRLMIKQVASVEQKRRLYHALEDFFVIERLVFLPIGQ